MVQVEWRSSRLSSDLWLAMATGSFVFSRWISGWLSTCLMWAGVENKDCTASVADYNQDWDIVKVAVLVWGMLQQVTVGNT